MVLFPKIFLKCSRVPEYLLVPGVEGGAMLQDDDPQNRDDSQAGRLQYSLLCMHFCKEKLFYPHTFISPIGIYVL